MTSDQVVPLPQAAQGFEDPPPGVRRLQFMVELGSFEGPLDLLLTLARQQKVDLKELSILALAEQYLAFISEARQLRLELAADYLVMAAWLAYLKSRLLLPPAEEEDEPSGEELAARLQHQLRRLEAMREAAESLLQRDRLGQDVFPRGMPEGIRLVRKSTYDCTLYDLLNAYASQVGRNNVTTFRLRPVSILSIEEALSRLKAILGDLPDWASLETFLPDGYENGIERRSAMASTFTAVLETVRDGVAEIRQAKAFGPIFIKGSGNKNA